MTVIIIGFRHGQSDQQWYDWISPNKKRKRDMDGVSICPLFSRLFQRFRSRREKPVLGKSILGKRSHGEINCDSVETSTSKRSKPQPLRTDNGWEIKDRYAG
jgi:hypothetical protein